MSLKVNQPITTTIKAALFKSPY